MDTRRFDTIQQYPRAIRKRQTGLSAPVTDAFDPYQDIGSQNISTEFAAEQKESEESIYYDVARQMLSATADMGNFFDSSTVAATSEEMDEECVYYNVAKQLYAAAQGAVSMDTQYEGSSDLNFYSHEDINKPLSQRDFLKQSNAVTDWHQSSNSSFGMSLPGNLDSSSISAPSQSSYSDMSWLEEGYLNDSSLTVKEQFNLEPDTLGAVGGYDLLSQPTSLNSSLTVKEQFNLEPDTLGTVGDYASLSQSTSFNSSLAVREQFNLEPDTLGTVGGYGSLSRPSSLMIPGLLQKQYCGLCKKNKEPSAIYKSHTLKDIYGNVVCPNLYNYVCPMCNATGPTAHTKKFCPQNQCALFESLPKKTPRNSSGKCPSQHTNPDE